MLRVKIFGPGCPNCNRVEATAMAVLEELAQDKPDLEATIEKVQDPMQIVEHGVMVTPGLAVNEKLVCAGGIPSAEEVRAWMLEALDHTHS